MSDKTASLYNGEVTVRFADKRHRYTIDAEKRVSVTTVVRMVDDGKSGRLQGWAVKTVVLDLQFALMQLIGDDGLLTITAKDLAELIQEAKGAYRRRTSKAAEIGTQVHEWVEGHINRKIVGNKAAKRKPTEPQVRSGVDAYLRWEKEHHIEYVATETLVYSKEYDYAGTADIVAYVDGVLSLIDIKTSNNLFPTFHLQTAGYVGAYNEEGSGGTILRRYIVQLHKQNGTFHVEDLDSFDGEALARDFTAFLAALTLYWRFND